MWKDGKKIARVGEWEKMPVDFIPAPNNEYLQTPEWKARRKERLKNVGHRCQVCNSPKQPAVQDSPTTLDLF